MIGVVLWSDPQERKAVIWCEDHGELAFFRDTEESGCEGLPFGAGDLVEFQLVTENNLRFALGPQVLTAAACPGLSNMLNAFDRVSAKAHTPAAKSRGTAEIIQFQLPMPARASTRELDKKTG